MKNYQSAMLIVAALVISCITLRADYWRKIENIPSPYNNNYWLDVYFLKDDPNYGWICGYGGLTLRTTDGGATWQGSSIPGVDHMESVCFANRNVGFVSGPGGVYKSSDGGATWSRLNIISPEIWGCYFINENVGMVVGGGCTNGILNFWRTEDGGATWTRRVGTRFNSGLTDLMIDSYSGIGYASSSGVIWKTTDFGLTWTIWSQIEPPNNSRWQEEITNIGASFLIPYAGTDCGGGERDDETQTGGAYFSVDDGATWRKKELNKKMFGSYLINANTGWVCGFDQMVAYSDNGGLSWSLKNCGIKSGSLDDIWFNSPTDGWVVGQGVYRLTPSKIETSKDSLNFDALCMKNVQYDTLIVDNKNFDARYLNFRIRGDNSVDFELIQPISPVDQLIQSCDILKVIVKFNPKSDGKKIAYLDIYDSKETATVALTGSASATTAKPSSKEIDFGDVRCGIQYNKSLKWTLNSNNSEGIRNYIAKKAKSDFKINSSLPFDLSLNPNLEFSVTAKDTGAISETFMLYQYPCLDSQGITLKAYAYSPIINSRDSTITLECPVKSSIDVKLPIWNTGNAPLNISQIDLSSKLYELKEWSSKNSINSNNKILKSDTLTIKAYLSGTKLYDTCWVKIYSDDSTKVRGNKNPYLVKLIIFNHFAKISAKIIEAPLEHICLPGFANSKISIENLSFSTADYTITATYDNCAISSTPNLDNSIRLNSKQLIEYSLKLRPLKPGYSAAKFVWKSKTCDDADSLLLSFVSDSNYLFSDTKVIDIKARTGIEYNTKIRISSNSSEDLELTNVKLASANPDITIQYFSESKILKKDSSLDIDLKFTFRADVKLNDKLIFEFNGKCPINYNVDLKGASRSTGFEPSIALVYFDTIKCVAVPLENNVSYKNIGVIQDKITKIELLGDPVFSYTSDKTLPYLIEPNESIDLKVRFSPSDTGSYKASLRLFSENIEGEYSEIQIIGAYHKSDIIANVKEFNYGVIEYCDSPKNLEFNIINNGALTSVIDEKLFVNRNKEFSVSYDKKSITLGDSAKYSLTLDPSLPRSFGNNYDTLIVIDNTCNKEIQLPINYYLANSEIHAIKNEIELDSLWAENTKEFVLEFSSGSNVPVTISDLKFEGDGAELIKCSNFIKGSVIKPNEVLKLYCEFRPLIAMRLNAKAILNYKYKCEKSVEINIQGLVPEELYYPELEIANYTGRPNDSIEIRIRNNNPLPVHAFDSLTINFELNRKLLAVKEIFSENRKLNWLRDYDEFSLTVPREQALKFITQKDSLISIKSVAMISNPNECVLNLVSVDFHNQKKYNVSLIDGKFKLVNYCEGIGNFINLEFINDTVRINSKTNFADNPTIYYSVSKIRPFNIKIYDLSGKLVEEAGIFWQGKGEYPLDIEKINSGVYIIEIESYGNVFTRERLMIEK
jgi:photosystem II stability/assembly factor-like uncharacterized protein